MIDSPSNLEEKSHTHFYDLFILSNFMIFTTKALSKISSLSREWAVSKEEQKWHNQKEKGNVNSKTFEFE